MRTGAPVVEGPQVWHQLAARCLPPGCGQSGYGMAGCVLRSAHMRFYLRSGLRSRYWGAGKNSDVRKNQVDFLLGFRL